MRLQKNVWAKMAQLTSLERALAKVEPSKISAVSRASEKYLEYVNLIKNSEIKNFTLQALENAAYQFWLCPASSSGKFHPNEDNNTSGTIRHLIKAAEISIELCREFDIPNYGIENGESIVLSATLLHDVCKNGYPEWQEHTDYTHGLLAYNFLENFKLKEPDKKFLRNAVRYHMGRWTKASNKETEEAKSLDKYETRRAVYCTNDIERIVQLSDYFASRNNVSFMPGLDITKHRDYKKLY